jgi:hypothetical protein
MYGYMGLANATSPPLPQTPGGFGGVCHTVAINVRLH